MKRKYVRGWKRFRDDLKPIVSRIKKLPMEERLCYLASLKPYLEDLEYKQIITHLRGRKLIPKKK